MRLKRFNQLNEELKRGKRVHPDNTSLVKPTPKNQVDLYELLQKYDYLVDNELPSLVKRLKKFDEMTISWGYNRKEIKGVISCIEELKKHTETITNNNKLG